MAGPAYPSKILEYAFAYAGVRNSISNSPASPNASYNQGFPPVTMEPYGSGGVPPAGQDFNGIFYEMSNILVWANCGGRFIWDSNFAGTIGYPLGAVIAANDFSHSFICLTAGAATDPNTPANVDNINWAVWGGGTTVGAGNYGVDSGGASAYVMATIPATAQLYNGMHFTFKATNSSTGASTLNVGTGVKSLVKQDGTALVAGDITAGGTYECLYDGTKFVLLTQVNSQSSTPSGTVTAFAGAAAPSGWLLCDGSTYNDTTYPALFAVIGTTFGTGGAGTFKVPNLGGSFPMGAEIAYPLGSTGGSATAIMSHTHFMFSTNDGDFSTGQHIKDYPNNPVAANSSGAGHVEDYVMVAPGSVTLATAGISSTPQGATTSANSLPPYVALNYIIKA